MKQKTESLCAIDVFKATWKMLNKSENLEEAKENFKLLMVDMILNED
jgi:hypothetical protein